MDALQAIEVAKSQDAQRLIAELASVIRARRLEVPAIFFLEASKPLSSLVHTALSMSSPLLMVLAGVQNRDKLLTMLESRDNIEALIRLLEARPEEPA